MKKRLAIWLLVAIWISFYGQLLAQNYSVRLNAFTHTINNTFFHYAGYKTINNYLDTDGLVHYFSGKYESIDEAKHAYSTAVKNGFKNAEIVQTENTTYRASTVAHNHQAYVGNHLFIKRLSLKNGSGAISRENRHLLKEIVRILKKQPYLKLRIIRPSNALSTMNQQQLRSIGLFLLAHDIGAYRMRITNAHHDFKTAINGLTKKVVALEQQEVQEQYLVFTLINHQEEIVLDRFSSPIEKEELTTSTVQELSGICQWIKYLKLT